MHKRRHMLAAAALLVLSAAAAPAANTEPTGRLEREVHYRLMLLPYRGVFDYLAFHVDPEGVVKLQGQVARVALKSEAERALRRIEGIRSIANEIEVLPASRHDDEVRVATYRAIYRCRGTSSSGRYPSPEE